MTTVRLAAFALVFVAMGAALALHTGTGTPSAFGIGQIAAACPLGMLETMMTGRNLTLHAVVLLAAAFALIVVFGKAFCSWICPTKFIQQLFGKKSHAGEDAAVCARVEDRTGEVGENDVVRQRTHEGSRFVVLAGALLSSAAFGFPVFCLVCPIGLTFATFIALWHLFQFNELTWLLVVFPAVVLIEVVLFKKWCSRLCPLGALLSLASRLNKTFKPQVDASVCLREAGHACSRCEMACPEAVDPHDASIPECTKCGACLDVCPTQAISLKLIALNKPVADKATPKER